MNLKAKSYHLTANQGFTLIELIIYLAIMSVFTVSLILWSLSVGDLGARARAGAEVNASARFALEIITRDLEQATSVTTPAPNATSSTLVLINDLGQTVTIDLSGGRLMRTVSGNPALDLTSTPTSQTTSFVVGRAGGLWAERDYFSIQIILSAPPAPARTLEAVVNRRR